jgi:hypothetical protein
MDLRTRQLLGSLEFSPRISQGADAMAIVGGHAYVTCFSLDLVFVVGGMTDGPTTTAHEAYNPQSNTWEARASAPTARGNVATAVAGGRLYVFGGIPPNNEDHFHSVEAYDPVTNTWETKASAPALGHGVSAATVGNWVFLVGGSVQPSDPRVFTGILEAYDWVQNQWSTRAPLLVPRLAHAAAVLRGQIHVIGGKDNLFALAIHDVYDPVANAWCLAPPQGELEFPD